MLSSAPAARSMAASLGVPSSSSSTRDPLLGLPSPRPPVPIQKSPNDPLRTGSASTSGSASLVTCHVCGDQTRKSSLAFHQRKCIRDHIGRLSLDRAAHALQHTSSPTHQCTSCLHFIAAHLFAHHLRTCQGKPATRPYTTPAPAAPSSTGSKQQFTNGVRSPLPPIDYVASSSSSPVRGPGMGRTVSDSVVDYAPMPPAHQSASARPASRLGAVPAITLPSFASDPAIHVPTLPSRSSAAPHPPAFAAHPDDVPEAEEAAADVLDRVPCPLCGRKFVPESLPRHELACAKLNAKRRPVYNAQAMRVKGTELEKFVQIANAAGGGAGGAGAGGSREEATKKAKKHQQQHAHSDDPAAPPPPAWKSKSDAMRSVMKAVRMGQTAPAQENPDYVTCPTCARRFNEDAAKRHMQTCLERKQRDEFASGGKRAGAGGAAGMGAAGAGGPEDALMRRIKYQPPLPGAKRKKHEAAAAAAPGGGGGGHGQQHHPAGAAAPQTRGRPCCPGCGAGYLTQEAKFCFECGSRRAR